MQSTIGRGRGRLTDDAASECSLVCAGQGVASGDAVMTLDNESRTSYSGRICHWRSSNSDKMVPFED